MSGSKRLQITPNSKEKIQLLRPTHVYFEHVDLDKFSAFAIDFGFKEVARAADKIYYGGYGKDPYVYVASKAQDGKSAFRGAAFVAASKNDFLKAAALPSATVTDLDDAPGGGSLVTISRPNGTRFYVVYGQEERQIDVASEKAPSAVVVDQGDYNYPFHKPRLERFQRFRNGPALVHKLGHFGYVCTNLDEEYAWYTSTFNFKSSDTLYSPENEAVDVLTFMHLDRGATYVDHHCLFLARGPPGLDHTYLHHSSYEINDYDEQMMGHYYLAEKGWESVWGVGRHILGSQVFDYWHDTSRFKIEHYADGDVVNETHVVTREAAGPVSIWGPEHPKNFNADDTLVGYG